MHYKKGTLFCGTSSTFSTKHSSKTIAAAKILTNRKCCYLMSFTIQIIPSRWWLWFQLQQNYSYFAPHLLICYFTFLVNFYTWDFYSHFISYYVENLNQNILHKSLYPNSWNYFWTIAKLRLSKTLSLSQFMECSLRSH